MLRGLGAMVIVAVAAGAGQARADLPTEPALHLEPAGPPERALDLRPALPSPGVAPVGPGPALAAPRWGWDDTALQAALALGLFCDYRQTRHIVARGAEANPLIGKRGERMSPHVYFPLTFAVATAAAVTLPREWRRLLQGSLIGLQFTTVYRNHLVGNPIF